MGGIISYQGKNAYYNMFSFGEHDVRYDLTFESLDDLAAFFALSAISFDGVTIDERVYDDQEFRNELFSKIRKIYPSSGMRAEEDAESILEALTRMPKR